MRNSTSNCQRDRDPCRADRNTIYTQLEKIAATDAPWLPISHAETLAAFRSNIDGFYFHMTGVTPFVGVSKK
jgi:peptide/nickel transport system substrate-binding protein